MKYRRIYQTLQKHGVRISYEDSGWRYEGMHQTYIRRTRPLWIVAEAERRGLHLWVCHDAGCLSVTTADMTLPIDSREYHQSRTRRDFRTQGEMADYLDCLLQASSAA